MRKKAERPTMVQMGHRFRNGKWGVYPVLEVVEKNGERKPEYFFKDNPFEGPNAKKRTPYKP